MNRAWKQSAARAIWRGRNRNPCRAWGCSGGNRCSPAPGEAETNALPADVSNESTGMPRCVVAILVFLVSWVASPSVLLGQTPETRATQGTHREFQTDAFSNDDHALRLHVTTDKSSLTLAQRLTIVLEAQMPLGWQVTWPTFGAELGEFTVFSVSDPVQTVLHVTDAQGGAKTSGISVRRTLVLEPNYAEKHEIPTMEFTFAPPSGVIGKPIKLNAEPIEITVTSLLDDSSTDAPDPGKGRGIAPIRPGFVALVRQFVQENRMWVIVGGSTLAVVAGAASFIAMRRRRIVSLTPEALARKRLGRVVVPKDASPGEIAAAMQELADIAREYSAAQFNLPSADRTTEELLTGLVGVQGVPLEALRTMLTQFDLVKFAGATAHADDVRAAVVDVTRFVDATCAWHPAEQTATGQSTLAPLPTKVSTHTTDTHIRPVQDAPELATRAAAGLSEDVRADGQSTAMSDQATRSGRDEP